MTGRQSSERLKDVQKAATLYASGMDQETIGKELQCHQATVSKMLATSEAKAILEQESVKYLQSLSTISDSTLTQINTTNTIHKAIAGQAEPPEVFKQGDNFDLQSAMKYCELTAKREDRILAGHGLISGSGHQVNYVANIYNDNKTTILDPAILQAIGQHILPDNEVIDLHTDND